MLQLVQSSAVRPAAGYFSGFGFAGIPQRSLRNSSRIGNGGLKGRLHGRKPRSSGSPGLRRGRQFAHQRNCGRVVPRRGFHPLSWAEGPCGQARLPATQKAEGERRSSPGLNSQIAHDVHHFTSTVTDPNPEIARSRTITRTCCPSPAIATSPGMTRPFFIALSYSCCV